MFSVLTLYWVGVMLIFAFLGLNLVSTRALSDLQSLWVRWTRRRKRETYHNRESRPVAPYENQAAPSEGQFAGITPEMARKNFPLKAGALPYSSYRDAFLAPRRSGRVPPVSMSDAASELVETRGWMSADPSREEKGWVDPKAVAKAVKNFWALRNPASTEAMTHAAKLPRVAPITVPKRPPKKKTSVTLSTSDSGSTSSASSGTGSIALPSAPKTTGSIALPSAPKTTSGSGTSGSTSGSATTGFNFSGK